ncbi:Histidine kinase [Orbilia oligospora]|uniref:histidine kinase n=1 Tax=Orbilia oligospora TaxID=2813651 RepID=A0A7C8NCD7_ORBOL|nr:Histidine kinase [Orbilia oligospora]KAF3108207.1 Histidine kinase [Orbilia oligospora]
MRMRIKIREQLGFLVTILALCCVGIPSLISWVKNYHFVVNLRADRLALVAALKADQLSQALAILQNSIASVSSRLLIQGALKDYYAGKRPWNLWDDTITDIAVALETQPYLLQAVLWNRDLNETFANVTCSCALGINGTEPNGTFLAHGFQPVGSGFSWNGHDGFPDSLYPRPYNMTEREDERVETITPATIQQFNFTFQGPVMVNETLYLASYTVPIFDQTNNSTRVHPLLGFFTIIVNIQILVDISNRRLGLDETGLMLVVGPDNPTNLWSGENTSDDKVNGDTMFRFTLPAYEKPDIFGVSGPMNAWTTVIDTFHNGKGNPARADLSVRDISDHRFSVGFVLLDVPYLDWGVIIAQDYEEVLAPVIQLRNILLATIFGTLGVVILLVWPLSHIFVRPITRLSAATQNGKRSLSPRGRPDGFNSSFMTANSNGGLQRQSDAPGASESAGRPANGQRRTSNVMKSAKGLVGFSKSVLLRPVTEVNLYEDQDDSRNTFRIPSKVPERSHLIQDELTELTHKFNRMTEELEVQYETLEERVRQRTVQLEEQRQIAETANEAKSRFIANITHELRTPLNGILGMCAVCLAEDDIVRIKQSLGIVYKSGELLLHLLTDLLTFSRTQIGGKAIPLDIKRFRITDIASQVLAIFEKQARDSKIKLGVTMIPEAALSDMVVMGDSNRILQIIINLISNALKFTPESGKVHLTITLGNEFKPIPIPSPITDSRDSSRNRYKSPTASKSLSEKSSDIQNEKPLAIGPTSILSNLSESRKQPSVASESQSDPKSYIFEFKIQDTGPGIPIDQQQQIFEPFVQGELGLNRKYGGTGLGLSICKQLATLMSGTITLDSQEGVGSAFTLKIPLKHPKDGLTSSNVSSREGSVSLERTIDSGTGLSPVPGSKSSDRALDPTATNAERLAAFPQPRLVGFSQPFFAPSQEPQTASGGKVLLVNKKLGSTDAKNVRVLVAEDNKINQEVVIRMLKLEQIENITLADDGVEAVDRIKEAIESNQAFHIVFMDVQMPNLDGLESTRKIRELGYSAPIIALSALTEESNIKECLECGMNYFLAKPIRRPALKHVLRTYCPPIAEDEGQEEPPSEPPSEPPPKPTSMEPDIS